MWAFWLAEGGIPSKKLHDVVRKTASVDPGMKRLADEYFKLVEKLKEKSYITESRGCPIATS